jgi:hypothetical protein
MTADHEQATSADASARPAAQLRQGASSASRVEPGTGPVTEVSRDLVRLEIAGFVAGEDPEVVQGDVVALAGSPVVVCMPSGGRSGFPEAGVSWWGTWVSSEPIDLPLPSSL